MNSSQTLPPPSDCSSPTSSSTPAPHPHAAPPAQSPSPSRNHHARHPLPPHSHPDASQMFGTLPAIADCETIPAAPTTPPPYSRSSPDASLPKSAIPTDDLSRKCPDTRCASGAPAPPRHDCSAPPPPAPAHTCAPTRQLAVPIQTEENGH